MNHLHGLTHNIYSTLCSKHLYSIIDEKTQYSLEKEVTIL